MPTIEVLPSKPGASAGAGWAYTTLPPANSVSGGLAAPGGRGARTRHSNFENTAARQRQINSRISDLEKDNYRDVHIPLPKKSSGSRRESSPPREDINGGETNDGWWGGGQHR